MRRRFYGAGLTAGMVVATVNIVVAAPLIGLWVGSRLAGDKQISVLGLFGAAVTMFAVAMVLLSVLARLGAAHDRLTGRPRVVRRHVSWMRSMSGERPHSPGTGLPAMSTLDYVLVIVVVVTVILFEIWFAFYSGSPFDTRSGRG